MKSMLLSLLLLAGMCTQAQSFINISTGVSNSTGQLIAPLNPDDTWKVYTPGSTTAITPITIGSNYGWPNTSCARWIATSAGNVAAGDYIYETFFQLSCTASNPSLVLDVYACDNTFVEISINNHIIPFISGNVDDNNLRYNYVVSNLASYVSTGNNRLRVIVHNRPTGGSSPSPTQSGMLICGKINPNSPYTNNPAFTLSVPQPSTLYHFYRAATPVVTNANLVPGFGEMYIIEQMSYNEQIVFSMTSQGSPANPPCWWVYPNPVTFRGYNGSANVSNLTPCKINGIGRFPQCYKYRITRGTWNSYCNWAQYSVITVGDTCNLFAGNNDATTDKIDVNAPDFSYLKPAAATPIATQQYVINSLVSPNPGSGIFNINTALVKATKVEVYNEAGRVVQQAGLIKNTAVTSIDISNQPTGIYFIRIMSNTRVYTEKIVLTR